MLVRLALLLSVTVFENACLTFYYVIEPIQQERRWTEHITGVEAFNHPNGLCLKFRIISRSQGIRHFAEAKETAMPSRWLLITTGELQHTTFRPEALSEVACIARGDAVSLKSIDRSGASIILPEQRLHATIPQDISGDTIFLLLDGSPSSGIKKVSVDRNYAFVELADGRKLAARRFRERVILLSPEEYVDIDISEDKPFKSMQPLKTMHMENVETTFLVTDGPTYTLPISDRSYSIIITPELKRGIEKDPKQWARVLLLPVTLVADMIVTPVVVVAIVVIDVTN